MVTTLSPADRLDLQDLLLRYSYAARSTDNEDRLRDLFTDDVILDGPRGYHVGLAGLAAFAEQERGTPRPPDAPPRPYTIITNVLVEGLTDDTASIRACFFRLADTAGGVGAAQVTGSYECEARRVDGVWKVSRRICRIDGLPQFRDTEAYRNNMRYVRDAGGWRLEPAA